MEDAINPKHYVGDIECIDAMIQQFGFAATQHFCILNSFKYVWRCMKKHETPIEDVKKADWYLTKFLDLEELKTKESKAINNSYPHNCKTF